MQVTEDEISVGIRRGRLSIGNGRWIGEKSIKGKGLLSLDYLERSADIEGKGCEKRNARGKWRKCGRPVNTWTGFFTNRLWQFNQEEGGGWMGRMVEQGARICRFDANVGMWFIHPRPLGCSPSIPPGFSLFSFRFRLVGLEWRAADK